MKAKFLFKNEIVISELDKFEVFKLKKEGVKSMIGQLRNKVWTGLKLRGEQVTLSELKFKGIE